MFKFLKEKLGNVVKKFTKEVDEDKEELKAEELTEEQKEEIILEEKQEQIQQEPVQEKVPVPEPEEEEKEEEIEPTPEPEPEPVKEEIVEEKEIVEDSVPTADSPIKEPETKEIIEEEKSDSPDIHIQKEDNRVQPAEPQTAVKTSQEKVERKEEADAKEGEVEQDSDRITESQTTEKEVSVQLEEKKEIKEETPKSEPVEEPVQEENTVVEEIEEQDSVQIADSQTAEKEEAAEDFNDAPKKKKGFFSKLFGKKDEEEVEEEKEEESIEEFSEEPEEEKEELEIEKKEPVNEKPAPEEKEKKKEETKKVKEEIKKEQKETTGVPSADSPTKKPASIPITDSQTPEKKGFFGKVSDTFTKIQLSEEKFEELFWDLELALLEGNVAVEVIDLIKKDLKEELTTGKISRKNVSEIIQDTLKRTIDKVLTVPTINLEDAIRKRNKEGEPYIISVIGINGAGKTTAIAKLTHRLQKEGFSIVWAASDTFRAAAIQQLEEHANKLGVKMIKHDYNSDPAAVAFDAVKHAKAKNLNVVMIDTAGRMHSNDNLMQELRKLIKVNKPDMKIYVGESITGNDCVEQAKIYDEQIGIDGIILTKADTDEKGGAAISISHVTGRPILFLGTGQTYDDLEPFDKHKIMESLGL